MDAQRTYRILKERFREPTEHRREGFKIAHGLGARENLHSKIFVELLYIYSFESSYGGTRVLVHTCGPGEFQIVNIFSMPRFLQMCIGRDGPWFPRD